MQQEDIIKELFSIVRELRDENAVLLEIILNKEGALPQEHVVGDLRIKSVGREPWYLRKQRLEGLFRKEKEREETDASEE